MTAPAAPSPALSGVVTVRRRLSRALLWASGLVLLTPPVMIAVGRPLGWEWLKPYALGGLGMSLWLAPLLAVLAAVAAVPRTSRPASIHVDQGEVVLEGRRGVRRFPRADIEGGMLIPSTTQPLVELYLRGGDVVRLAVADEAAATSLLDALDIGPSERRVRVTVADPMRRALASALRAGLVISACFIGLGMGASAYLEAFGAKLPPTFLAPWLVMVVGAVVGLNRLLRPAEVTVGAEGVRILTGVGDRTIAYESIEDVQVSGRRLDIHERGAPLTCIDGGRLLGLGPGGGSPTALVGLARRIREGMIGVRSGASEGIAARLERGERSFAEWREAVGQLFGHGGYRSSSLAREVAEHVLEDGAATVDRRLGAALALAAHSGEEDRARIRIAAQKTTDDKLRIALLQVADGDEGAEQEIEALIQRPAERRATR
jgi:hypothetical protein